MIHPPTPDITGLPVMEGESGVKASADVRPYLDKADEPGEAKDDSPLLKSFRIELRRNRSSEVKPDKDLTKETESTLAKTGHKKGTTALAVGLHDSMKRGQYNFIVS